MRILRVFLSRLGGLFHKERRDRELADEIESHLHLHIDDNLRAGMNLEAARRAAILKLGGIEQTKEAYRDRRSLRFLETLLQDLRYGARVLCKSPGYTFSVVVILAIGLGVSTFLFSVLYGLLLRPLPYLDAEHLVSVEKTIYWNHTGYKGVSIPDIQDWRGTGAFSQISAYLWQKYVVTGAGEPVPAVGLEVQNNFFQTLGVHPFLGCTFNEFGGEDRSRIVVISYPFWKSHLGGDPNAVGRTLRFDDRNFTVVGVMPPDFGFPVIENIPGFTPVFWAPLQIPASAFSDREDRSFEAVGRLAPGISTAQAQARVKAVSAATLSSSKTPEVKISSLREILSGNFRTNLFLLMAADALVLAILVANLTSLLLARSTQRLSEMAVRLALGASRWRVARQLIIENLSLGALALAAATAVAYLLIHLLPVLAPRILPPLAYVRLDLPVLVFSCTVAFLLTLLVSVDPAFRLSRLDLQAAIQSKHRSSGTGSLTFLRSLLAAQVALSFLLLIGAGLLFRSLDHLQSIDTGFRSNNVLTARLRLPDRSYSSFNAVRQFHQAVIEHVSAIPGVQSVAIAMNLPLSGRSNIMPIKTDRDLGPSGQQESHFVERNIVTPDYFKAMGVHFLNGKVFSTENQSGTPSVAVINQKMAEKLWPGSLAVGRQFQFSGTQKPSMMITVIGVVQNEKHWSITDDPEPKMYLPYDQADSATSSTLMMKILSFLVIKSDRDLGSLAPEVKRAIWNIDPNEPVEEIASMEHLVSRSLALPRFRTTLLSSYALFSTLLAFFGIYSVAAYLLSQRQKEFGIRIALGAQRFQLIRVALHCTLSPVLCGLAIGFLGSMTIGRFIAAFLYGIKPIDSTTYAIVLFSLILLTALAAYLPARRAARVDPMTALREE